MGESELVETKIWALVSALTRAQQAVDGCLIRNAAVATLLQLLLHRAARMCCRPGQLGRKRLCELMQRKGTATLVRRNAVFVVLLLRTAW